ncbi:rhodanese-like domain-containing protein [Actinoplanes sp. NEAU-A12]|uniref:Rhodanese-like domain-containing protein n=1 Tax=Actinoplanes sandaracinus TaxID=3045177 RepID=A0ABT6WSL4_9ACTN|nr:rhodanese-like domain-containing protein [Actinoplanes sandaracinus]MDI6102732.1 rhodanese-like domain-containing protein [Actinoplanes sandaracinus]
MTTALLDLAELAARADVPAERLRHYAETAVRQIDRDDLGALLDAGAVTLVEASPVPHHDAEHLPGAANLPGELSADRAARLAPERAGTVVTCCAGPSCGRSTVAAAGFIRLGCADVRLHNGGKTDWSEAGLLSAGARATPTVA